jgi:hypothetical protein
MMTVAAFILGIIGTVLATASLGWQVWSFRLQGARPKLTPVIGTDYGGGALPIDATADVRPSLLALEAQLDADPSDRIVGVTVVNKGRADLSVTRWSFRALPAGTVFLPPEVPGCPSVPCTIPPGGEETFFTALNRVRFVAAASEAVGGGRPQRVVVTVTSGGHTYTSEPIYTPMLADGAP